MLKLKQWRPQTVSKMPSLPGVALGYLVVTETEIFMPLARSYNKSLSLELLRGRGPSPPPEAGTWRWEDVSGGARFQEQAGESRRSTRTSMGRDRVTGPSVQQAGISGKAVSPATAASPSSSDENETEHGGLLAQN